MSLVKDILRLQTDVAVASGEILMSRLARRRLVSRAKQGAGQPVLLLPGYKASGRSMAYMRDFLNECGFDAHTWGLGRNTGITGQMTGKEYVQNMAEQLMVRVRQLAGDSGHKVTLIGQSLGGLYARETAIRYPQEIDRVITLGSPTIHPYINDDQNSMVVKLASRDEPSGSRQTITGKRGFLHWGSNEPALPCVAIWSPIDAVVFSQSARIPDYIVQLSKPPAVRENVRIVCSHAGMGYNEAVLLAVVDRLVEKVGCWQALDMRRYYPQWQISLVEGTFSNRLFHDFIYSDWRENLTPGWTPADKSSAHPQDLVSRLVRDHNDFLRLYQMIEKLAANEQFGSEADYLLLADVVRFMTLYLDQHHHPLEEFVLDQLVKIHPPANAILERLSEEHKKIETAGQRMMTEVERAAQSNRNQSNNKAKTRRLLTRWRRFCEVLRRHVKTEERELFPLIEENIPADTWPILEKTWQRQAGESVSPLSRRGQSKEFRPLFEYLNYVANANSPESQRASGLITGYMDSLLYLTEQIDNALEKRNKQKSEI